MEKIAEATKKVPLALQRRPVVDDEIAFYIHAFYVLDKTRRWDSPITLSEIDVYSRMTGEDPLFLAEVILESDLELFKCKQKDRDL